MNFQHLDTYEYIPEEFAGDIGHVPGKWEVGGACPQNGCDGTLHLLDRGEDLDVKKSPASMAAGGEGGRFRIICSEWDTDGCTFDYGISNVFSGN